MHELDCSCEKVLHVLWKIGVHIYKEARVPLQALHGCEQAGFLAKVRHLDDVNLEMLNVVSEGLFFVLVGLQQVSDSFEGRFRPYKIVGKSQGKLFK